MSLVLEFAACSLIAKEVFDSALRAYLFYTMRLNVWTAEVEQGLDDMKEAIRDLQGRLERYNTGEGSRTAEHSEIIVPCDGKAESLPQPTHHVTSLLQ